LIGLPESLVEVAGTPGNWAVERVGANGEFDPRSLDMFLYFPGDERLEAGGRPLFEAMAAGRPVVADEALRPVFGDAAVDAAPSQAWERVRELWEDGSRYHDQVERGRDFVTTHAAREQLAARLGIGEETLT
jgi:hypothetical protein